MSEWVPTERPAIVNEATPLVGASVARDVAPSIRVTMPVADEDDTVAVNITAWPYVEGLELELRVVVVGAGVIEKLWLTGVATVVIRADLGGLDGAGTRAEQGYGGARHGARGAAGEQLEAFDIGLT